MRLSKEVLLVEDDEDDVSFMREAVRKNQGLMELKVVRDGEAAMAYLRGQGEFAGALRPALILLDLKLPKKSGFEVLRDIRRDPALRLIPVLVLTTSDSENDVREAYTLGANCFFTKPTGATSLEILASLIEKTWFVYARLPSPAAGVPN